MTTLLDRPTQSLHRPLEPAPKAPYGRPPRLAQRPRWPGMLLVGVLAAGVGFGSGFGLGYISRNAEVEQLRSLGTFITVPAEETGAGYTGSVVDSQVPDYTNGVGQGYQAGSSVHSSQIPSEALEEEFPATVQVPHGVADVSTAETPVMVTVQIPRGVAPIV